MEAAESETADNGATGGAPASPLCAACGAPLADGFSFCESCGAPTGAAPSDAASAVVTPGGGPGAAPEPVADEPDGISARTTFLTHPDDDATQSVAPAAAGASGPVACSCGGRFEGGWCDTCGAPEPDGRDHVVVTISPALGSVSDRGVVHHPNEDAGTVVDLGGPVACIVADGVSSAEGSQAASGAAVAATSKALVQARSEQSSAAAPDWFAALRHSRSAAAAAASSPEVRGAGEAPSCTWVAAITDGAEVWTAWVGDSRTYVVRDDGRGQCLSTDHSWAAEAMAAGTSHDDAMADRRAHMITAWLGRDAPEIPDATARAAVEAPGWLLVVSDGLWNYCDAADDLAGLVARLGGAHLGATDLAEALVGYANAAGGADNITVAAARLVGPRSGTLPAGTPPADELPTSTPPNDTPPADGVPAADDPTPPGA